MLPPRQTGPLILLQTYIAQCYHDAFACPDAPAQVSLPLLFNHSQDLVYLCSQVNFHCSRQTTMINPLLSSSKHIYSISFIRHLSSDQSPSGQLRCVSVRVFQQPKPSAPYICAILFICHPDHIQSEYFS